MILKELGYNKPVFILAFDHRSSFYKMFGYKEPLTPEQAKEIADAKWLVYEGFKKAVSQGEPSKEFAGVLVDEQFGDRIHRDAGPAGFIHLLTTEKSGQDEFDFEHGEQFGEHIEKYKPNFAKVLIRYNPEGDKELNARQRERLRILGDWCHEQGYKFLIEPLIPATPRQLESVGGDEKRYDTELRYKLMAQMIKELQEGGVEPDVWKIEGLEDAKQYEAVIAQAQSGGRENVKAVVLGRGADPGQVERWLQAGAKVSGIIGFAIGRTIFRDALEGLKGGKLTREQASAEIAQKYQHFYKVFVNAQNS
ncbi:MAG: DUF2090 domain-containing protein [Candidatus Doudnabacteria bacterium]|nr:DUF2090 domain-containing protein [Candidatus Doudnabacteria bacterium]